MSSPVIVRGVEFPSVAAAARAIGVSSGGLQRAIREGKLESVGVGVFSDRPVTLGGVLYRSKLAASDALGVHQAYIIGYFAVCAALDIAP